MKLMTKFPDENWTMNGSIKLLKKLCETVSTDWWWHTWLWACAPVIWETFWAIHWSSNIYSCVKHKRTNFYCIFCIICHNFSFCILQGSVATCLRCDGKYYVSFVGNVVVFPMVKEFLKIDKDLTKFSPKFGSKFQGWIFVLGHFL